MYDCTKYEEMNIYFLTWSKTSNQQDMVRITFINHLQGHTKNNSDVMMTIAGNS